MDQPLWTPSPQRIAASNLSAFTQFVAERYGVTANSYAELHTWSCHDREQFWQAIWQFCGVVGSTQGDAIGFLQEAKPMNNSSWANTNKSFKRSDTNENDRPEDIDGKLKVINDIANSRQLKSIPQFHE